MSDYTINSFHEDYEKVVPLLLRGRNMETLDNREDNPGPESALAGIVAYFTSKYGNARGTDYQMRFFSVMQFIEHYREDLIKAGIISDSKDSSIQVSSDLIKILLGSFRPPQPPSPYPSSPLWNQNREFNYNKVRDVLNALKKE